MKKLVIRKEKMKAKEKAIKILREVLDICFKDQPVWKSLFSPVFAFILMIMIKFVIIGCQEKLVTSYFEVLVLTFLVVILLSSIKLRVTGYSGILTIIILFFGLLHLGNSEITIMFSMLSIVAIFFWLHLIYIILNKFSWKNESKRSKKKNR